MKWKVVLAGLLVVLLSLVGHLEARGFGQLGGRGFAHVGARGFGHFGHHGLRDFAFGISAYPHFGYGYYTHRFYNSCYPLGYYPPFYSSRFYSPAFPFGYSMPFYGYSNYSAPDSGIVVTPPDYYGDNSSQPYVGKISKLDVCKDTWTDKRNTDSLSGVINSLFKLQCESEHPNSTPNHSQDESQD